MDDRQGCLMWQPDDPGNARPRVRAHIFYPFYLSSRGQWQEALAVAKNALDLDPASPSLSHSLAVQFYLTRQFDQAIEQCRKTLEMDPNFAVAYAVLGQAYLAKGMNSDATPVLEKYSVLSQGSADSHALLGYSQARRTDKSQTLRTIEELKATFGPAFYFALVYGALEDKDQAFMWLEKGYDERFARFATSVPRFADNGQGFQENLAGIVCADGR